MSCIYVKLSHWVFLENIGISRISGLILRKIGNLKIPSHLGCEVLKAEWCEVRVE